MTGRKLKTTHVTCISINLLAPWIPCFVKYLVKFLGHFFFFWPRHTARRILVPRPGIEHVPPAPPALEVQSLNHWTAREVPLGHFCFFLSFFLFLIFIYLFRLCRDLVSARRIFVVACGIFYFLF